MGIFIPVILLMTILDLSERETTPTTPSTEGSIYPPTTPTDPHKDYPITVLFRDQKQIMDMETYLIGVVLAEMPASFHLEALKAQAVAARTYTIKRSLANNRHGKNTICTDYSCCQAYIEPEAYIADGGTWDAVERVSRAVESTAGEVVVYEEELITATYFSCAGGITEDAEAVWGQDVPYLQPVISPGEEYAPVFSDSKSFTPEALQAALGTRLEGPAETWFSRVTYTPGGGVDIMTIADIPYKGTTLRTLLGLRSTIFTVSVEDGVIIFHTRGFGHRVGMSQYGANAMATSGKTHQEILSHYYSGTKIVQYFAS